MLAALLRPLFSADSGEQARELVSDALDRPREPLPKIATLLKEAEDDLLAFYAFPADHRPKLRRRMKVSSRQRCLREGCQNPDPALHRGFDIV
jgi:transposase-like protein